MVTVGALPNEAPAVRASNKTTRARLYFECSIVLSLLIFDGDCAVCTSCANWARRHVKGAVEIAPWQRIDLATHGLTPRDAMAAAWWVSPDGRRYRGHLAIGQTLRQCGGWWRLPAWFCLAPPFSWVASLVYRLVARYRHHLPGATPACRIPDSS
jgi:predicted DCC family thiol-disulfide oxidoreductase YuxK